MASKKPKAGPKYRVCSNCRHVRSLHVLPGEETPGRRGCMHENVADGSGGAGSYCSCEVYEETISSGHEGYLSSVRDSDIVLPARRV